MIYLDHHSTTPCDARVVEVMLPYLSEEFGNPASRTHAFGWRANEAVERARAQVARGLAADARELVFTSGATEANNLASLGWMRRPENRGGHILTVATEHSAVLDPIAALAKQGCAVTHLGVDAEGCIDQEAFRAGLRPETRLVSVMLANNEIGTIQELAPLTALARERGVLFHTDAAQAVGRIPVDVHALGVDLLSLTAHKFYGPKGIGALYIRRGKPGLTLTPLQYGGGHERGLRSGTLPAPLCVALGKAVELATTECEVEGKRIRELRDGLYDRITSGLDGVALNGAHDARLPGNLNLSFSGIEGEALVVRLAEQVAVSTGAACSSARPEPSHVLRALGRPGEQAQAALRFGLGRGTTLEEIDRAAELVIQHVGALRGFV